MNSNQIKAVMLGHAVGDALGVPVEFQSRAQLKQNPVTNMKGFGTYSVPAGTWSDDTSMSLCAFDVLAKGYLNFDEIMRNFGRWYYENGFTATGETFDVGNTCSMAINNYHIKKLPSNQCGLNGVRENGNGSLMRIHPFCLYLIQNGIEDELAIKTIHSASALTHAHARSKMACGIYYFVLKELLNDPCKDAITRGLTKAQSFYPVTEEYQIYDTMLFQKIAKLDCEVDETDIFSSGYVVHSLEAAMWCLRETQSYRDCVLKAVNLGEDTDTVGAIAGSLAGALYGYDAIPKEWLDSLKRREDIESLCNKFYQNNTK